MSAAELWPELSKGWAMSLWSHSQHKHGAITQPTQLWWLRNCCDILRAVGLSFLTLPCFSALIWSPGSNILMFTPKTYFCFPLGPIWLSGGLCCEVRMSGVKGKHGFSPDYRNERCTYWITTYKSDVNLLDVLYETYSLQQNPPHPFIAHGIFIRCN